MKKIRTIALVCVGMILVTAAIFELPHMKSITQAPLVEQMTVEQMTREASVIVEATVAERLGTIREEDASGDDAVYTRYALEPTNFLKGSSDKLVVRVLGGRYLTTVVDAEDQPMYEVGQKALVFLTAPSNWQGDFRTVGEFQGKFTIDGTNATQDESGDSFTLAELEKTIKTTLLQPENSTTE